VQFYNIPHDPVNRLTRIVADDLENDEVSSLVEYMTAISSGQISQHKKILEITGLTNKKIKFLLHKFLYTRHLPDYRVLDTAGNFEIVHLRPEKKQSEQHETLSPTMIPESIGLGGLPRWGKPSDMIEWEGKPPPTRTRYKKK
jgi:alkylated DNA nucleotide flippase Atl1